MSGTLFVVATPIGNLEDITLRALRVLREADVIAAEDTRRTAKLLAHYAITTSTLSFHEHNTRTRMPQLLARLSRGEGVALVSDAGTPGISDPGVDLIQACWDAGIPVDPIPGASAPLAAAVASGFPLEPLTIFGFVPARAQARKTWWGRLESIPNTVTFFETPHRIGDTLAEVPQYFGGRPICLAREVTKRHQEFIRSPDCRSIHQNIVPKGEFTVVIGPKSSAVTKLKDASDTLIYREFCQMTADAGIPRRPALAAVARKYGRTTKQVYAIVEALKKSDPTDAV
jgi:16S rRNA (cytidine1402-2'-O)-methyltransferase